MNRRPAIALVLLLSCLIGSAMALDIPEPVGPISDYAEVLSSEQEAAISRAQQKAYDEHDVAIAVVTIRSMGEHGGADMSIEDFAREWFDTWEIGKVTDEGTLYNKGMLLLVSLGDRKARIELGADWEGRWDSTTRTIMQDVIIPQFRSGDYGAGIVGGTQALAEMAKSNPADQPAMDLGATIRDGLTGGPKFSPVSPFNIPVSLILILIGVGCIIAAVFFPDARKPLLIAGISIIVITVFMWLILAVVAIFLRGRTGGWGSSGGSGFGGGGFSGGGGASGSW